ncbi:MAG: hypothetical protein PVG39_24225 [Desulfobacteraceae bacterium]|jgi:hypothetical protein
MVLESNLDAFLDCGGVDAIIDSNGAVKGAVFESKSGRQTSLIVTGARLFEMPMTPERVKAALAKV